MYDKPIQHGEMVLKPIGKLPDGDNKIVDEYIGAPSKSSHHHVLRAKNMRVVENEDGRYVEVVIKGVITHQKQTEGHKDLRLPAGIYQINIKTEYDIFEDVIKAVED